MKKPIIASNIGGSKEKNYILNKNRALYNHEDPRELAEAINRVMQMDNDALNSMANEGRRNVSKKFDVDKMCQRTFAEYKKIN